ncbi:MAG TPA: cyclopropane-fatty-acyl-phospholipid synthase family protein [Roseiarcus sp.]|nr:cyclopropane-fatty-acyl-phospholipid synthase family protein [Roseiarcus sp.]
MDKAEKRLASVKALLDDAHRRLGLEIGFRLWDGAVVPVDWPSDALMIVIADEGAVASLIRAPRLTTLANLWVAKRLDIVNGDLFDLVAKRPKGRTRDLRKGLNKLAALRTALAFLFVARGGPWPLEGIGQDRESSGAEAENKRNIAYHYDVSNAFYRLWLDEEMVYSCAYFHDWSDSLDAAQTQKLDMICRKLRLQPGETMLDIGSGWGSLACHAARHYGVKVLGVTLSEQQIGYAREKVQRLGLADKATFEFVDYAQLDGAERFDKISSVGMFEHIGVSNFATYFDTVHRLLRPGGLYLHHAITRPGKRAAIKGGKKRPEFAALTRYIFPGGELDYLGRTIGNLELHGFEVHDVEGWREHYQRTCRLWHDRLAARYDEACREVGEAKTRLWQLYLASCSIVFERGGSCVYQTLVSKRARGASGLPPTRTDLYR